MRILIISTSFAPDNGIASKRTSIMTKYLLSLGHDVTVIRSGLIFGIAEKSNLNGLELAKIYSYEGKNSPADSFEGLQNNEIYVAQKHIKDNHNDSYLLYFLKTLGHIALDPILEYKNNCKRIKKLICNLYDQNNSIRGFDIVISSFGPLGCIAGGEYIKKHEHSKWIIDFRDLMDNECFTVVLRLVNRFRQKHYLRNADACLCVSEGNGKRLASMCRGKYAYKVHVLYNGFEIDDKIEYINDKTEASAELLLKHKVLHICYTGMLYGGKRDCTPLFKAIKMLEKDISVQIDYAGRDGDILKSQATIFGLEDIIVDYGYLSKTEVNFLQQNTDIFLVISWNTKKDQGILTGKFYEALQHKKPIIALVGGDLPNSELKMIINKYHLGFCYEEADKNNQNYDLVEYLKKQYDLKKMGLPIMYKPDTNVFAKFEYSNIVKELEQILIDVKESVNG